MLKLVVLITRGLIAETHLRRWAMFVLLIAAMLMIFAGVTFLSGYLADPWHLLIYWGLCALFTFAALLLALFDMLVLRAAARRERRRLEREIIGRKPSEDDDHHAP